MSEWVSNMPIFPEPGSRWSRPCLMPIRNFDQNSNTRYYRKTLAETDFFFHRKQTEWIVLQLLLKFRWPTIMCISAPTSFWSLDAQARIHELEDCYRTFSWNLLKRPKRDHHLFCQKVCQRIPAVKTHSMFFQIIGILVHILSWRQKKHQCF